MKKKLMMLSCIAAVAIATVVGKKTFESHAYETSSLLMQNVEALSTPSDDGGVNKKGCKTNTEPDVSTDKCIHNYTIGNVGIKKWCSDGEDPSCQEGFEGTYYACQIVFGRSEHPGFPKNALTMDCK